MNLTKREREAMVHALGLTPTGGGRVRRWAYRNYYVATDGGDDWQVWDSLCLRRLARINSVGYGMTSFGVTEQGVRAMGETVLRRVPRSLRYNPPQEGL